MICFSVDLTTKGIFQIHYSLHSYVTAGGKDDFRTVCAYVRVPAFVDLCLHCVCVINNHGKHCSQYAHLPQGGELAPGKAFCCCLRWSERMLFDTAC